MGQGQILSRPIVDKDSGYGEAPRAGVTWGYSGHQGWRVSMEDSQFALGSLPANGWEDSACFGVFDGHGGADVALTCKALIPDQIALGPADEPGRALVDAFHRADELFTAGIEVKVGGPYAGMKTVNANDAGCTAVVAVVRMDSFVVANAGDSRAVLCRNGQAVPLSYDHKPELPEERERITKAGATLSRSDNGSFRVNYGLNLSRSIGDLRYKQNRFLKPTEQAIVSTPDIITMRRQAGDEFMVLACDGVWDMLSNQQVVDFVRERLPSYTEQRIPLHRITDELLDSCVTADPHRSQGLGTDNMTALLVVFSPFQGTSTEEASTPTTIEDTYEVGNRLLNSGTDTFFTGDCGWPQGTWNAATGTWTAAPAGALNARQN